ncbi:MAG: hypothetical protein GXY95_06045 [Clostridiales bacterium]|nr:hypothetical protein [Clostridiales bacterium]HOJ36483.1 hypothetical protein [Clostridiales bacterium]HOL78844.1 hypothetical protein [Clostridiales bacterium]HPU67852.1 hypothetical protein [Clostridiales bacterium]HQA05089.1 hypothetical protein [Clostridiales bacterium]
MLRPRKLVVSGALLLCALTLPIAITQTLGVGGGDISEYHSAETTAQGTKYTVRAYEEKIAVFVEDETVPSQILDVFLFSLPPADAEILENGITVYGEESLARVIEDYTS